MNSQDQSYISLALPSPMPRNETNLTESQSKFVHKFKKWLSQPIWKTSQNNHTNSTIHSNHSFLNELNQSPNLLYPSIDIITDPQQENPSDSVGTFMTGNKPIEYTIPQFQEPVHQVEPTNFITSQISNHLKFKYIDSNKLRKRLYAIATRKEAEIKSIKKFLKDINHWSDNPLFNNDTNDTKLVIKQINILFSQDLVFQDNIAKQLKSMINNLEYVALKETDLINDHKKLLQEHKKYNNIKVKRGENHPETSFSLERVLTAEHVYESLKKSFQKTISITMRQLFQELSYEYYSNCEDLKNVSSNLIQDFMMSLEVNNFQKFNNQLDQLRRRRSQKIWSQFSVEDKKNPIKWENMKTGIYEKNDSLLQNIYKNLPKDYTLSQLQNSQSQPNLDFKTGLESTYLHNEDNTDSRNETMRNFSIPLIDRYNPISTNTFLSKNVPLQSPAQQLLKPPTSEKENENEPGIDTLKSETDQYPTLNPKNIGEPRQLQGVSEAITLTKNNVNRDFHFSARTADLETNKWETIVL